MDYMTTYRSIEDALARTGPTERVPMSRPRMEPTTDTYSDDIGGDEAGNY